MAISRTIPGVQAALQILAGRPFFVHRATCNCIPSATVATRCDVNDIQRRFLVKGNPWRGEKDSSSRSRAGAKEAALKLLSYRPYPVRKLTDKLREKGYGLEEIGLAIEDLERLGLTGDAEYAETYVRSKWRQQLWAPSRLQLEMSRLGISQLHQRDALRIHFGRRGLQLRDFLTSQPAEALRTAAAEAFLAAETPREAEALAFCMSKLRRASDVKDRQRFYAWLQRRGFSFDETNQLWWACQNIVKLNEDDDAVMSKD